MSCVIAVTRISTCPLFSDLRDAVIADVDVDVRASEAARVRARIRCPISGAQFDA